MRKSLLLGLLSLGMATVASARQRGAVAAAIPAPAVHVAPAAPVAANHAAQPQSSQLRAHFHPITANVRPVLPHKPVGRPVPPLLPVPPASTSRGATQAAQLPPTGFVLSVFGAGGYYVPAAIDGESSPQEEAQENDSNQQADSNPQPSEQESSAAGAARSNSNPDSPEEPLAEFVFVQRDGRTLFAVAYTTWNDKVQYVTKEGLRRSVALDSLDLDATQKLNEERGNTIHLPTLSSPA
jgi:hypothetical protein